MKFQDDCDVLNLRLAKQSGLATGLLKGEGVSPGCSFSGFLDDNYHHHRQGGGSAGLSKAYFSSPKKPSSGDQLISSHQLPLTTMEKRKLIIT